MKSDFVRKFKVDTSHLSKDELIVLEKLTEVAGLIAKIYEAQLKDGFYPKGATRQEIEKAASKDPEILSPYTMVERDSSGQLVAVPYHKKYKELLLPIVSKLTEAAQFPVCGEDFRKALIIQAKVLLNGNYDFAQISWMKIKPCIIDIVVGPIERVEDNLFFVKRSYQAWVGISAQAITERMNVLKEIVFSARRQILLSEKVDFMTKAQLRVDKVMIFAGMIANYHYSATTLPNDIELLEKYGSEGWIFLTSVEENFEKRQFPLFDLIFAPSFRNSFNKAQLLRGYMLLVALHEIARIIVRYRFAVERLKELYPIFNEITAESLAVKMAGMLLLKDVISQKEMEAILVMFITRMFDGYNENAKITTGFEPLLSGNAILLNSLIEGGAVKMAKDGISWPNFTKMFISVDNLAEVLERIMAEGVYKDAYEYLKRHSSLAVFKKFSPALKTLLKT